jgi:hypothetical protein
MADIKGLAKKSALIAFPRAMNAAKETEQDRSGRTIQPIYSQCFM